MATIQRFLFDTSFDDGTARAVKPEPEPAKPPPPPPPPPEPTFTVAQVREQVAQAQQAAHAAGVAEGRAQGRAEADREADKALADALDRVERQLSALVAAQQAELALRRENTPRIALAVVRKLFPAYVRRHGLAEVEAVVAGFLEELAEEPKLVIKVHEAWLDRLRERIDALAARHGFPGTVTVLADPRLGELDVKADWGAGGAERDATALWREVERLAGDLLADKPGGPGTPVPLLSTAITEPDLVPAP